jgi:hypothetical protein
VTLLWDSGLALHQQVTGALLGSLSYSGPKPHEWPQVLLLNPSHGGVLPQGPGNKVNKVNVPSECERSGAEEAR